MENNEIKVNNYIKSRRSTLIELVLITCIIALLNIGILAVIFSILDGSHLFPSKEVGAMIAFPFLMIVEIYYTWCFLTAKDYILGNDYLQLPSPRSNMGKINGKYYDPVIFFADIERVEIIQTEDSDWTEISKYIKSEKVIGLKIITKDGKEYSIIAEKIYPLKETIEYILNFQEKTTG